MSQYWKIIFWAFFLLLLIALIWFLIWFFNKNSNQSNNSDTSIITTAEPYEVPILMYHYIRTAPLNDNLGASLSVDPLNFALQVKWLKDNNYQTIFLKDLADPQKFAIKKVLAEGLKPIVITFDDGYRDAYTEAFPVLKNNGFSGTFFIIRESVGKEMYLTQEQINIMAQSGMEIGSHSLSHPNLAKAWPESARKQIFDSKNDAEVFCYPSGQYSQQTIDLVKQAGYVAAVTTEPGLANEKSNLFALPRVRISNVSLDNFIDRVRGKK